MRPGPQTNSTTGTVDVRHRGVRLAGRRCRVTARTLGGSAAAGTLRRRQPQPRWRRVATCAGTGRVEQHLQRGQPAVDAAELGRSRLWGRLPSAMSSLASMAIVNENDSPGMPLTASGLLVDLTGWRRLGLAPGVGQCLRVVLEDNDIRHRDQERRHELDERPFQQHRSWGHLLGAEARGKRRSRERGRSRRRCAATTAPGLPRRAPALRPAGSRSPCGRAASCNEGAKPSATRVASCRAAPSSRPAARRRSRSIVQAGGVIASGSRRRPPAGRMIWPCFSSSRRAAASTCCVSIGVPSVRARKAAASAADLMPAPVRSNSPARAAQSRAPTSGRPPDGRPPRGRAAKAVPARRRWGRRSRR